MRGGEDKLLADILSIVHADDKESKAKDATAMMRRRLVPEILLQLARKVSPF
jgi:prenylcysteine alpha-carboxyl methylesterase